jgi:hypothetical protein
MNHSVLNLITILERKSDKGNPDVVNLRYPESETF